MRRAGCRLNGAELSYDEDDAFAMVMRVAEGNSSLVEMTAWFAEHVS